MLSTRIAIVVAEFNEDITSALLKGAVAYFQEKNIKIDERHIFYVPGAVELPLAARRCALTGCFDAVIVFGAVIKGETDHYDYVSQSVTYGCQKVALEQNIPVIFGVLTTPTHIQAQDRVTGVRGHHGREAACATLKTLSALEKIESVALTDSREVC